jgi:hypothetical protein
MNKDTAPALYLANFLHPFHAILMNFSSVSHLLQSPSSEIEIDRQRVTRSHSVPLALTENAILCYAPLRLDGFQSQGGTSHVQALAMGTMLRARLRAGRRLDLGPGKIEERSDALLGVQPRAR